MALVGGNGDSHGENSVGMGADIEIENCDNDCELMFDSDIDETLIEPPAESEKSRQLDQMLAWATKTLVDC